MRENLGHKNPESRWIENIPKKKWWINKKKSSKKKFNAQLIETLDNDASDSEDSSDESNVEDAIAPSSGAHTIGWSEFH